MITNKQKTIEEKRRTKIYDLDKYKNLFELDEPLHPDEPVELPPKPIRAPAQQIRNSDGSYVDNQTSPSSSKTPSSSSPLVYIHNMTLQGGNRSRRKKTKKRVPKRGKRRHRHQRYSRK